MATRAVTIIAGDGIGPEVMAATLQLVKAAGVELTTDLCVAGEAAFAAGVTSGVPQETIDSLSKNRLALKGPLATPVGFGGKSANVTLRKLFETYANIRPAKEIPGVPTPFSGRGIDLVVVRENVEDLYAGIEYMQTPTVAQGLKLISRLGSEKIIRTAFEYARSEGRKKVHCTSKANIMKLTEGLFKRVFEEVAKDYSDIEAHHILVDNLAHQLVIRPEEFEIIVATNMNGDIISDLTSGLIGGLGFAPSANIGDDAAIFEAVHGSAPDIAGKDLANPTALMFTATLLLRYINELEAAKTIENALLAVLERGEITTGDVKKPGARVVGTSAFTEAIIAALGQEPTRGAVKNLAPFKVPTVDPRALESSTGNAIEEGIDLFVASHLSPRDLGNQLEGVAEESNFRLKMISNRGTQVYPVTGTPTDCVDHFRCRFILRDGKSFSDEVVFELLSKIGARHRWMHLEKLFRINGERGYTMAQGES